MRTTLVFVAAMAMGGCAAQHKQAQRPQPSERGDAAIATTTTSNASKELGGGTVKIVARRPVGHYKLVGHIQARAHSSDIVDAAIAVDADLRRQAKALGADVVRVDTITTPTKNGHITLAGRAYKKSS